MKGDFRYTTTDCLENFPFPTSSSICEAIGRQYHDVRRTIMLARHEGLTKTYARMHDSSENSEETAQLRALHVKMDYAVVAAYGWNDVDLEHGFIETKRGARYTISDSARRTVLDRLLVLNHQRHAGELKAGLHSKGAKKHGKTKAKLADGSASPLFG